MEIVLVGVSHKTAPVETRERLAVPDEHVPGAFEALLGLPVVRECAIISTCNRTELYALGDSSARVGEAVVGFLASRNGLRREDLEPHLYKRVHEEAVRHLFAVSAGLDSLIVGEGQILSQVRKAHQVSRDHRGAGQIMGKLFERAIRVGKRARTETRIAQGATSVSFAAVELAKRIHGDLKKKRVLVVGTGKMGALTLKLLMTAGAEKITVLSRRLENARRLVEAVSDSGNATCASMAHLEEALVEADVVISCTASLVPVITFDMVKAAQRKRRYRPLFIVDIAVPRDVEPEVNDLDDVYLYNVDDLANVVQGSLAERAKEMARVHVIIDDELDGFLRYCSTLETVPVIKQMRAAFEASRRREVAALLARERLSEAEQQRFEAFSRTLLARLLHEPTVRLKELSGHHDVHNGLRVLLEVFGGGDEDSNSQPSHPPSAVPASDDTVDADRQEEPAP